MHALSSFTHTSHIRTVQVLCGSAMILAWAIRGLSRVCSHCLPRLLVRFKVVHINLLLTRCDDWLMELNLAARAGHALIIRSHVSLHLQRLVLVASTSGARSNRLLLLIVDLATLSTYHASAIRSLIGTSIAMLFASLHARTWWSCHSWCISVFKTRSRDTTASRPLATMTLPNLFKVLFCL